MPTEPEFESVLVGARAHAEWAWRRLYEWYAPVILQFLRAQRAAHPEDVLAEVFLDVVRGLHRFEGDSHQFRSWLFRIAHHRFLDERRAHGRRAERPMEDAAEATLPQGASADDIVLRRAHELRLYRMLQVLPEDQRAAVFMRVLLDMSPAEIADVMGRRVGSTKMLIQRGLKTLRDRADGDLRHRP